ncbi:MAG TPA: hypothetical protein VK034_25095, partial [Enhygromyxa sp.]|nr:hypothetical protein [Enhygromyxa sp.]
MSRLERTGLYSTLASWLLACGPGTTAIGGDDETSETGETEDTSDTTDEDPEQGCVGTPTRVVELAVANHSCALFDSGHVKCWGPNQFGQLGLGTTEPIGDDELPAEVGFVALDGCATAISVSARGHSCAALESGAVQCWGRNDFGELGLGHIEAIGDDELPSESEPLVLSSPAIAVTTASASSCALLASGDITCWGSNLCSRLGIADAPDYLGDDEPVTGVLVEQKSRASALFSGAQMNCLTDEAGLLTCWGATTHELGHLPGEDPLAPYGCHPPIEATP